MSRCRCCDRRLETSELSKKDRKGEYLETCKNCMASVYETNGDFYGDNLFDGE